MTKRQWIKNHRNEIDAHIKRCLHGAAPRLNDRERELWILNDEALYNWARSEGVKL